MTSPWWRASAEAVQAFALRRLLQAPRAFTRGLGSGPPSVVDGQTLDPQLELLVRLARLAKAPPIESMTPDEARARAEVEYPMLAGKPRAVEQVLDLEATHGTRSIPLRLYRPKDVEKPVPAVLWLHGGGWVVGSIRTHEAPSRLFAALAGCAVVSVDYGRAPEHRFPSAVEDAVAAYCHVVENAERLGLHPRAIGVGGDSAGGNLAAVLCHEARERRLPKPALQILIYPVTDLSRASASYRTFADGYILTANAMAWFIEHYLGDTRLASDPRASPLASQNFTELPPALIHTAGFDPLRDEGRAYADRLEAAGIPVKYTCHADLTHGYWAVAGSVRAARRAIGEIALAAGQALRESR
jgi:acetyl esterase/lipase